VGRSTGRNRARGRRALTRLAAPAVVAIPDLLEDVATRFAARTALVGLEWNEAAGDYARGASTTYAELYGDALRLADALAARGLRRGDRLAVLLDNSAELVVTEWACLVSGMVWVALNVRSSAHENAAILRDCSPAVLIVSPRHRAQFETGVPGSPPLVVETGAAWDALLASGQARRPPSTPGEEDIVRLRYTSGTAGRPKGAMLPRRCYDASVEVVGEVIGPLLAGDVLAQIAPMTHAAGAMWMPHAVVGATALLADRFDARAFLRLVLRERVTSVFLVPTMLVRFVEALSGNARPNSLRSIVYGGASTPADRLERGLELLGPVFVQIYGLTESNWPVTALRREEHVVTGDAAARRRRLASCGRPTSVGEVRIVAADGREAGPGETGEMLVRGRNTMVGYWGKDDRGEAKALDAEGIGIQAKGLDVEGIGIQAKGLDAEGWMHTGDVAIRDADGFITIVDRLHDMIVSGGFNVYPREVEDALSSHPAVLESAVVGRPDPEWGERVHAVVVLRPGAVATASELAAHVGERTAPYKKPRTIEFAGELPKNAAGKVLRRVLKSTTPPA
jgi:acyl-CoA synthetase (AMP-forming)/AMP-acid ligase II